MNPTHYILAYWIIFIGVMIVRSAKNVISDRTYCGYQHIDDYARSNYNISIDEFPWMAQLVYSNQQIACSGSLINYRYVLTAAHCMNTHNGNPTMVRLGDYNMNTEKDCINHQKYEIECSDPVEEFQIEEIIVHPSYRKVIDGSDIALLRLSRNVIFSDYIRPICLPKENSTVLKTGDVLATSGWGLLGDDLNQTELKKRIMATLISAEECVRTYKPIDILLQKDHLCARGSGSVSCRGDSGAPLMYSIRNQWEQVGVTTFSARCESNFPVVYVNVFNYLSWMQETIRP